MHQRYLKIPKSECPYIWIRLPKHKRPQSWSGMEDPVVPLERNLYSHPTILISVCGRCQAGRQDRKHGTDLENSHARRWSSRTNIISWPCIFGLESVNLVTILWQTSEICSNPGILLEPRQNYLPELQGNLMQKQYLLGLMTWKVTQRSVWREIANLQIKRLNNYTKSQRHAWMTINLKKKKMSQLENCLQFAHNVCWNVCIWLVLGDLISCGLWTNLLARSQNGQSCDKRLARLISYIHHASAYLQYCYVGNTAQQCRLGLFQDSDFTGDLEDLKSTSSGVLCIFGSHTFVPTSWMCKKQTFMFHTVLQKLKSSLSMQVYAWTVFPLSLFGIWWLKYHSVPNRTDGPKREPWRNPSAVVKPNTQDSIPIKHTHVIPSNIDHIPSDTTHSGSSAM